eukprot:TRINITY_DN11212_c0_g1_i1.p1 TRINITY_DN11212_c0_g1~~TRINITY_DN11212_c0_g1_i1.p1  ORF type:complete len:224 (+),score=52.03 TRINITY_DN11212_c0_g1_i1:22-693(+)
MSVYFQTERCIIRDWVYDDFNVVKRMLTDVDVVRFMSGEIWEDEQIQLYFQYNLDKKQFHHYVISLKENFNDTDQFKGHMIGYVGVNPFLFEKKDNDNNDTDSKMVIESELEWVIDKSYWKQGYASEVASSLIEFGFQLYPNINRLFAFTKLENIGSVKVMEKINMKLFCKGTYNKENNNINNNNNNDNDFESTIPKNIIKTDQKGVYIIQEEKVIFYVIYRE